MNKKSIIIMDCVSDLVIEFLTHFESYTSGNVEFNCDIGTFQFRKTENINEIIVFEIFILEEHRNKGLCKHFLKVLVDNIGSKSLCIESVLSKPLYNLLSKFEYKGYKFKIKKEGFVLNK